MITHVKPAKVIEQALEIAFVRLAAARDFHIYQSVHAQLTYLQKVLSGEERERSRLEF
ncbi:MAG: immunity protein Tsi6 family protein [Acidobacteriota bacterium]|nr:immunity protein Tsi6 family protein [Acidobacteriota bacterium]